MYKILDTQSYSVCFPYCYFSFRKNWVELQYETRLNYTVVGRRSLS